jgi:hypothetical protein
MLKGGLAGRGTTMTEAEWLACTDLREMLEFLREKSSDRKLRLFACACCRRIPEVSTYRRARIALDAVERYADGLEDESSVLEFGEAAYKGARWTRDGTRSAAVAASQACCNPSETHLFLTCVNVVCNNVVGTEAVNAERAFLAACLREIFGPLPFRPVSLDPSWLTWKDGTIPKMAQVIYEDRDLPSGHLDNARLAVLGDALEDAGCTDADILNHCRAAAPHVRGCWVIDLLLGKA